VAGVQLDGGEDGVTGRSSSGKGSSIGSSGNWGSWEQTSGETSISSWAESSELSRPLGSGSLSLKSSEESSLGFSNLRSINNRSSVVNGGYWESSVVDRGDGKVVSGNSESKVISNIVDSVDSSLVSVGVRSLDTSVGISLLLLGGVDVLVSVGKVAELILSLELGADWASNRGGNGSSSNSNRGGSISSRSGSNGYWGSSISSRSGSNSNWGSSVSSRGSSNSWGVSSGVLSSYNRGGSSESRGSSHWSSSERAGVKSCDRGSVGKLGINSSGNRASICMGIGGSIASIPIGSVIQTSASQVLGSDGELSLGGSSGENGGDNSKELHFLHFCLIFFL
jgi:hypothetical protein